MTALGAAFDIVPGKVELLCYLKTYFYMLQTNKTIDQFLYTKKKHRELLSSQWHNILGMRRLQTTLKVKMGITYFIKRHLHLGSVLGSLHAILFRNTHRTFLGNRLDQPLKQQLEHLYKNNHWTTHWKYSWDSHRHNHSNSNRTFLFTIKDFV